MSAAEKALELLTPGRGPSRELRLVRRRKRKLLKRSRASKIVSIAIAAAIGIAAIVAAVLLEQVTLAQSAFKLHDLRTEVLEAQDRHEELLLEAAQLDSAARIETYARTSLGMVDPAPGAIRYIVADVRGAAAGTVRMRASGRPGSQEAGLAGGTAFADPYAAEAP